MKFVLRTEKEDGVLVTKRKKLEISSNKSKFHYVWIKNLSRLVKSQITSHVNATYTFVTVAWLIFIQMKNGKLIK